MKRKLNIRRLQILPAIALLFAGTLVVAQTNAQTPTSSDEMVPRKVVERLLDESQERQLLMGRLPEQLPVELPLPDQARVVVSVIRDRENYQILLDVPQPPERVKAFYQERLQAAGWEAKQNFYGNRGFVASEPALTFCKGVEGPLLSINAIPAQNAPTDVRLYLRTDTDSDSMCQLQQGSGFDPLVNVPLPALSAPPNTKVNPKWGGIGSDYWVSRATLETELDPQALAAYYEAQLKKAGWTRLDAEANEPMISSTWMLKDKKGQSWLGVLSFSKREGMTNQYSAAAMVSQL